MQETLRALEEIKEKGAKMRFMLDSLFGLSQERGYDIGFDEALQIIGKGGESFEKKYFDNN